MGWIMITLTTIQSCLELGLIYSLVVIPVWLSSVVIRFYDVSVEGSFCAGGAITAFLLHLQFPAIITIPVSLVMGALIGLCTGLLYTKLRLNDLLSGIIVTTGLFSINLALATSNKSLSHIATLFSYHFLPYNVESLIILLSITIITFCIVGWLLKTEIGFIIRALGQNPSLLQDLGKNQNLYTIITLMFCNALVALAGSLFVQYVGFFSIWTAVGILVIALACLKIGQLLAEGFGAHFIVGAIVYQVIIATTLELHILPEWNKLVTALLMVFFITISRTKDA